MWYAAHIIMYVKYKKEKQKEYPIWENVYLVEAESIDVARKKATEMGKDDEGDSKGSFVWDNKPSTFVYAGIRKLIECQNSPDQLVDDPTDEKPGNGTEITYSQFLIESEEELQKLVNGEPVKILYEE